MSKLNFKKVQVNIQTQTDTTGYNEGLKQDILQYTKPVLREILDSYFISKNDDENNVLEKTEQIENTTNDAILAIGSTNTDEIPASTLQVVSIF